MSALLYKQGKLERAVELLREVVDARRAALGDAHPETLISLANLGSMLLCEAGSLSEAATVLREATDRSRDALGGRDANTLSALHSLGLVLHRQGRRAEAEPHLRSAFEGSVATLGNDHPTTRNYAGTLKSLLDKR